MQVLELELVFRTELGEFVSEVLEDDPADVLWGHVGYESHGELARDLEIEMRSQPR